MSPVKRVRVTPPHNLLFLFLFFESCHKRKLSSLATDHRTGKLSRCSDSPPKFIQRTIASCDLQQNLLRIEKKNEGCSQTFKSETSTNRRGRRLCSVPR